MSRLHLACAADSRYIGHSAAMLHSAITNGGGEIVVHYLHGPGFPEDASTALRTMLAGHGAEIVFHEIPDEWTARLPVVEMFGRAMWYRVFLPELLPNVSQLLYLDVDTIVVDRLEPLWQLDLSGYYLAAVTNVLMEHHLHHPGELGLEDSRYFNSGVLMLNLELMRRDGFSGNVLALVAGQERELSWPDQDALNLAASSKRLPLHPRWNCMNSFLTSPRVARQMFGARALTEALNAPGIRHFEGPGANKPWHLLHAAKGQRLYREHRAATPWASYRMDGATPWNRAKRAWSDLRNHRSTSARPEEHA
jgi:lipopolysaccharide biosynthesis glycosyltransferase